MKILLQVRHNQHQVIPTFECKATNWEQANEQLTEGLELIRCKNQYYKERGIFNSFIYGIIDFELINEAGTFKGQFGFDITKVDKSVEELIEWYLESEKTLRA